MESAHQQIPSLRRGRGYARQRADWATRMPAITTAPPTSCVGPNVSPNQAHATTVATTGSSVRHDRGARRADVPERSREQREGDHRPDDDDERHEQPDRRRVFREVPLQRDALAERAPGKVPEWLDHGPEQRGKEEAVERERGGVAVLALALRHEQVGRQRQRAAERRRDADGAERDAGPELNDEREARQAQRDGDPDASPNVLSVDEAREERDEERRGELDEQRDADREVLDRHEVEPLHERDADEAERDEEEQLAPADPQTRRRHDEEKRQEQDRRARVPDLCQLERREAGTKDDLRHAAVDCEERRGGRDHDVAAPRLVVGRALDLPQAAIRSGGALAPRSARIPKQRYPPHTLSLRGVAQPGRALALGARGRQFKSARPDFVVPCSVRKSSAPPAGNGSGRRRARSCVRPNRVGR